MTNKEAKEIIESECYVFNPLNLDRTTKINTALDVAVEALEKQDRITQILDDCPLVEVVNCKDCKYNDEGTCYIDGLGVCDDYFCASGGKERVNDKK